MTQRRLNEGMEVLRVESLPDSALDASATFHSEWLPEARKIVSHAGSHLVIILPPAAYDHDDWRRAAIRDLARECSPKRVVMVAGAEEEAFTAALTYLERASGVTGQYLKLA